MAIIDDDKHGYLVAFHIVAGVVSLVALVLIFLVSEWRMLGAFVLLLVGAPFFYFAFPLSYLRRIQRLTKEREQVTKVDETRHDA